MRWPLKMFSAFIPILVLSLMAGCGGSGSAALGTQTDDPGTTDGPGGTDDPVEKDGGNAITISKAVFYDAVREVTPSFDTLAFPSLSPLTKAKSITTAWESGNPVYELFYLLQEFDPATDQGVVDTSNVYKTMWEAGNFLERTMMECAAISGQIIVPPFDFGNVPETYDCAFNEGSADGYDFGGALRALDANGDAADIAGDEGALAATAILYGLFGFVWVDDHSEYGTFQGTYDVGTKDLSADIAVWVDYEGANDYCYRSDIDGNSGTHFFTLRAAKGNRAPGSSSSSIVGKGYSRGEGKHFLMKMTGDGVAGRYYCIGAEGDEAELRAMDSGGSAAVDAECAEYQDDVDAMALLTAADLACDTADFNPDGTEMAAEGTIFLDYR